MLSTGNSQLDSKIKNEIASSSSLKSTHQVTAEWNYNSYTLFADIGCYLTNALDSTSYDNGIQKKQYTGEVISGQTNILLEDDVKRKNYTPLKDVFKPNRPNPGIVHSVATVGGSSNTLIGMSDALNMKAVFNTSGEDTRLYPIARNAVYRYWNSARTINGVEYGVSNSSKDITYAAPFIKYGSDIKVNKIRVKTQKHLGYPLKYRVDTFDGTSWSTAYQATGSEKSISSLSYLNRYYTFTMPSDHGMNKLDDVRLSRNNRVYTVSSVSGNDVTFYSRSAISGITAGDTLTVVNMSDGILDIYYDPSSNSWGRWTPFEHASDEKVVVDFSTNGVGTKTIEGVRFVAEKMSEVGVPLELIEISPRLVADITNSVISFDISSSMNESSFGLPVGAIVSSSGNLKLSNSNRFFSKNNSNSILQDILKPNIEIKLFQKLTIEGIDYRFPMKTMYTDIWDESEDFTVSTRTEDYFKFFKEITSPDIVVANNSGIPTSVAILMLLDNIGFTGFRFEKTNNLADAEDFVMDFFYSNKEKTVMETLEAIAVSTQTSMYVEYDSKMGNELVAMTKEKVLRKTGTKDFWMIGNDTPKVDSGISYVSNIASFNESSEPPITDINISYAGIGIEKKSFSLLSKPVDKTRAVLESPDFGVAFLNRDLKYTTDIIWQPSTDKNNPENYLAAAALIKDISETRPTTFFGSTSVNALNKDNAIRAFCELSNAKNYMEITLDNSSINTFSNTYSGYVLVESEVIRYSGIKFRIFDFAKKNYKKVILFSKEEYNNERSKLGQGGTIEPESLIVYLELSYTQAGPLNKNYFVVNDGRGQKNTKIVKHIGSSTSKEFLEANTDWKRFGVAMYNTTDFLSKNIVNGLTARNKINTFAPSNTATSLGVTQAIPGHLHLSAPKSAMSNKKNSGIKEAATVKIGLPMNGISEQIITGIFKTAKVDGVNIPVRKIGTRMRLFSDVQKNASGSEKLIKDGVIAGIAWNISPQDNSSAGTNYTGFTGYVLEIEEVGTIDEQSIGSEQYRNLRLYKITGSDHKPTLLDNAWVNVSSTTVASLDYATSMLNAKSSSKSYATIFDLEVVIRPSGSSRSFDIYWEGQSVISFKDTSPLNETSNVGLITRGPSSAIYEYFYVFSSPDDVSPTHYSSFLTKGLSVPTSELARTGILPEEVKINTDSDATIEYKGIFEDFGGIVREVKRFDIRYKAPSIRPQLISLAKFNPNYYVSDFETTGFGGSFWLYNTSNAPVQILDNSTNPLWISGFTLKQISSGTLQSSKYIESSQESKILNDTYDINRGLYGRQEVSLSGDYINNLDQAKRLAEWVTDNLSNERKTINLSIFPNPLFELGDKVGLLYSDKEFTDENKTYTVSAISHSISNAGPNMQVSLKECV